MAASWFGGLRHCWLLVKKKNGSCPAFMHKQCNEVDLQVDLCIRSVTELHIWGYSSKQKLVVRRFSKMFPDVSSLPICGSDRINQVLYRQEGSKTFRDFPRGLRDLLQSVAQIYTVYI